MIRIISCKFLKVEHVVFTVAKIPCRPWALRIYVTLADARVRFSEKTAYQGRLFRCEEAVARLVVHLLKDFLERFATVDPPH